MLNREQQQQEQVDGHRDRHGGAGSLVDALGHAETREEASRVAKHHQEEQVNDNRVHQNDQRGHPGLLRVPGYRKTGRLGGV